ncbi:MAG: cell division protein ZapA [Crocinitomicaceae bacterium]|nr:cell division protein ZapA [Crocinitomicaceae bacterium]
MNEVSIKVNIAGRAYPLTVEKSEEPLIRKAEQQIEESIKMFQQNYAVKDKLDLLAMAALQVASRKQAPAETIVEKVVETVVERVEVPVAIDLTPDLLSLENLLDSYLD